MPPSGSSLATECRRQADSEPLNATLRQIAGPLNLTIMKSASDHHDA